MIGALLFLSVAIAMGYIADELIKENEITDEALGIILMTIMSPLLVISSALIIFFTKKT